MFNYDVFQLGNSAGVYGTTTGCSLGANLGQIALGLFGYGFNTDYSSYYSNSYGNPYPTQKADLTTLGIISGAALLFGTALGFSNAGGISGIQENKASNIRDDIQAKEKEAEAELAKVGEGATRADYQTTLNTQISLLNNQTKIENQIAEKQTTKATAEAEVKAINANISKLGLDIKAKNDAINVLYQECKKLEKTMSENPDNAQLKSACEVSIDLKRAEGRKLVEERVALEAQLEAENLKKGEKDSQIITLGNEIEALGTQKEVNAQLLNTKLSSDVKEVQAQKAKLDKIYTELDALYEKYLDKADGNAAQRASGKKYSKLFDQATGDVNDDANIRDKDIREAINRFRNATEPEQKQAAADTFRKLWDAAGEDITSNPTFKGAYNLINSMNPEEIEE